MGILKITNFLIALFIMLYAFLFLNKTSKRSERRPWDYLFFSSFIFVVYQVFTMVGYFAGGLPFGVDSEMLSVTVEFMYSGLVLLAFVSQHDLIINHPLILLSRRKKGKRANERERRETQEFQEDQIQQDSS